MNVENMACWSEILAAKDDLTLRELSDRFGPTPGQISAALRRAGVARSHDPTASASDALPPEPGESPALGRMTPNNPLDAFRDQLGKVPDAQVAAAAKVSLHAVANYRARHGIPAHRPPSKKAATAPAPKPASRRSRIDDHAHLLGTVPDRVVADKAGVSLNAVRNYRARRGIASSGRRTRRGEQPAAPPPRPPRRARAAVADPERLVATTQAAVAKLAGSQTARAQNPAERSPEPAPQSQAPTQRDPSTGGRRGAWVVRWRGGDGEGTVVVLGRDLSDAAVRAQSLDLPGPVVGLDYAGELLG